MSRPARRAARRAAPLRPGPGPEPGPALRFGFRFPDRPAPAARPVRALLLLVLALLVPSAGCTGRPADAPRAKAEAEAEVRRAVADWAAGGGGRPAGVPLESWAYEVRSVRVTVTDAGTGATAGADLRYRLAGHDGAPAGGARELTLAERDGHWRVEADRPAPGALPELWDQGPVEAVRGRYALVLGTGPRERLTGIAAAADAAVPAVAAAWPSGPPGTSGGTPWSGRAVLLVPGSADRMAALLGSAPGAYRGMAAVTTGRVGASPAPADRVVVNPDAYAELGEEGRRIVLTHEITHVATRPVTSASTPMWLSEGLADWVAYRGSGRTPPDIAPATARAVRTGRVPAALPANGAFAFGGDQEALSRAYEESWLACRTIAARWGEQALLRLYTAAAREPLPEALSHTLHTDLPTLTTAWQQSLRTDLPD
ncbi:hypothetical protein [Streptomyces sp. NPDC089799]|uniref:hypothetical protein n=1 Tax=Streptomyces sp. NPDC089799 TaxID=3155066 RepID=UPI00342602C3